MNKELSEQLKQDILDRYDNTEYWEPSIIDSFWHDFHSVLKVGMVIDKEDIDDFIEYHKYDLKEYSSVDNVFLIYNKNEIIYKLKKLEKVYQVLFVFKGKR